MAVRPPQLQQLSRPANHQHHAWRWSHQMVKAAVAVAAGGALLVLSGLTLAGTVIALTMATPLLVIFSPVLVPSAGAIFVVWSGVVWSGGLGVAAVSVVWWLYKYLKRMQAVEAGADKVGTARTKLALKAREMKEKVMGSNYGS